MAISGQFQEKSIRHINSRAAEHMCQDKRSFDSYSIMQKKVSMADGKHTMAVGIGNVILDVVQPDGTGQITVTNVLHTPELSANLLSVSCLTTKVLEIAASTVCLRESADRLCNPYPIDSI